jgi:hypothetical protein
MQLEDFGQQIEKIFNSLQKEYMDTKQITRTVNKGNKQLTTARSAITDTFKTDFFYKKQFLANIVREMIRESNKMIRSKR